MGCEKVCDTVQQIIQGQRKELLVQILNADGTAKDLTGVTNYWSIHPTASGGYLVKKDTDGSDPLSIVAGTPPSKIKIPLSTSNTSVLKVQVRTELEIVIDFPSPLGRQKFRIVDAYDVLEAKYTLT